MYNSTRILHVNVYFFFLQSYLRSWQILSFECPVVGGWKILMYAVPCWPCWCTPHTVRAKLRNLSVFAVMSRLYQSVKLKKKIFISAPFIRVITPRQPTHFSHGCLYLELSQGYVSKSDFSTSSRLNCFISRFVAQRALAVRVTTQVIIIKSH